MNNFHSQVQGRLSGCLGCSLAVPVLGKDCIEQRNQWRRGVLEVANVAISATFAVSPRDVPDVPLTRAKCCRCIRAEIDGWRKSATSSSGRVEQDLGYEFSFSLLKKAMMVKCGCLTSSLEDDFAKSVVRESEPVEEAFLQFVEKETKKIFKRGWDKGYESLVYRCSSKTSACTELPRKFGGARRELPLPQYLSIARGEVDVTIPPFRFSVAPTAGKMRPLTITPAIMNALRPLHVGIANVLKKQKWLLSGPPTLEKVNRAGFKFARPILSGDYKSATDSLNLRVSSCILATILSQCTEVPEKVRNFAIDSLMPTVEFVDRKSGEKSRADVVVTRGQMMGSLLSFPLLCLYNRFASLWALGRVPMLINGDDLIAETDRADNWFAVLPPLGLSPEKEKTGVSNERFEINSTLFCRTRSFGWVKVNHVRCRSLAMSLDVIPTGSSLAAFLADLWGSCRKRAESIYIRHHASTLRRLLKGGVRLSSFGFSRETLSRNSFLVRLSRACALMCPAETPLPKLKKERDADLGVNQTMMPYHGTDKFVQGYSAVLSALKSYGTAMVDAKGYASSIRLAFKEVPRFCFPMVVGKVAEGTWKKFSGDGYVGRSVHFVYGCNLRPKITRNLNFHTPPQRREERSYIDEELRYLTSHLDRCPPLSFVEPAAGNYRSRAARKRTFAAAAGLDLSKSSINCSPPKLYVGPRSMRMDGAKASVATVEDTFRHLQACWALREDFGRFLAVSVE